MISEVNCPYCGKENDINHGYEEDVLHEQQCSYCDKTFTFETIITFSYESFKADCLNEGGEHKFLRSLTYPEACTKMNCETCEETRSLTESEWAEFDKEMGYNIREEFKKEMGIK